MSNAQTENYGADGGEAGEADLSDVEEAILDELKIGRCNPRYLIERVEARTGEEVTRQQMNYLLRGLRAENHARKVAKGLYEFKSDPRADSDPDTE